LNKTKKISTKKKILTIFICKIFKLLEEKIEYGKKSSIMINSLVNKKGGDKLTLNIVIQPSETFNITEEDIKKIKREFFKKNKKFNFNIKISYYEMRGKNKILIKISI